MPRWNTAAARRLVAVGLPISGTAALELALLNADTFIIAELLGTEQLAFYALAFNVSSWPATIVSQAVRKVSIGAFASIAGNDARVATTVATGLRLLVGLVLPLAAGIAVVAPSLLGLIYGPKSAAAVPLLRWLAVLGGVRVLTSFLFDALVSTRHQRFVLGGQTVWFVAGVAAVWWGAHRHGTVGVAAAHAVVALLVAAPLTFAGLRRLGADNRQLGTTLLRYALAAAVATAAGVLGVWLSPNAPAAVAIGGLALLGVYCLGLVATGERSLLTEFSRGPKPQRR